MEKDYRGTSMGIYSHYITRDEISTSNIRNCNIYFDNQFIKYVQVKTQSI